MIKKIFGVDFNSEGGALTLDADEVEPYVVNSDIKFSKTHDDGWTIIASVHEDWYEWINYFEAQHPIYGKVWGDFEDEVFADSEEGFQHFYENHPPKIWDYGDI